MDTVRRRWLELLLAERERRVKARLMAAGPREWLLAELDKMGERLAAAPDYRPLGPEESAEAERELADLLGSRG